MANLTTVAAVKAYLTVPSANQDSLIASLIVRESAHIEDWTGRVFPYTNRTARRLDGPGGPILVLPDTPILSVSSVSVDGTAIAASSDGILQAGYTYDDTYLKLIGGLFYRGIGNVVCSWVAGYQTSETGLVPAGNTITPTAGGTASTVTSVYDNTSTVALTQVSASPLTNEYSFAAGVVTFNSAKLNHSMTIGYYYIPAPVEQACIEMVGLDLQQRNSIGMTSKSLAGESVSYETRGMSKSAMEMLQPYRRRWVGV